MAKANKPAAKFRIGYVAATVWQNDDFYNVTLARTYKDGEELKETNQFGTADLANVAEVSRRALDWIISQ